MHPELSFNVIILCCAPGIVLHQETFFFFLQIVPDLSTLQIICLLLDFPESDPGWRSQSTMGFHPYLFLLFLSLHDACWNPLMW
jgi:hypothetical protein